MKKCNQCSETLPLENFYKRNDSTKYQNKCKKCMDKNYKNYYKNNSEKILNQQQTQSLDKRREQEYLRKYNMTLNEWNSIFESQNFSCAICGTKNFTGAGFKPHVDHNHSNGKIRGLLCADCNHGIGKLKEDISILYKAIEYLKKHNE